MPDIRYVCLSDVHFGAENSILSGLVAGDVMVDTTTASTVLDGLVAALTTLIGANEDQDRKPTLILNGDILELALASDNVALMVFELFLDLIFPAHGEALFDTTILYQPGNHDHHLWETARERQYGDMLQTLAPDAPLPIPWHTTRMFPEGDPRPVQSELLNQLARRRPNRRGVNFRVSYPNMGLRSADGRTAVVFHHGHFVEAIYHLMTSMKDMIFPGRVEPTEVWDVEAENFAWIDFFWSTLGRSGQVGEDVGLIYDMLQSDAAIQELAGNLAAGIAEKVPRKGVIGRFHWLIRLILDKGIKLVATNVAATERKNPTTALSEKAEPGLMAYLSGPLLKQLASEAPNHDGQLPDQLKFVFGHTHKPCLDTRVVPGLANPVRIFNTGGWVVDTLDVEPLHGANLALIDESLEVACVRLYNQAKDPAAYRVRLDDGLPAEQGPFYRRLSEIIKADDAVWTTLSSAAASLVTEREDALARIIANAGQPRPSGSPTAPAKLPAPPVPQTPSPVLARGTGATTAPPATPAVEPPPPPEPGGS